MGLRVRGANMNKFALGLLTACAFTTKEGREVTEKAIKTSVKLGDKFLKAKMGIDVKSILDEEKESEVVEDDE